MYKNTKNDKFYQNNIKKSSGDSKMTDNFKNLLDSLEFTYLIDQSKETLTAFKEGKVKNLTGTMIIAKDYPELVKELYAPELRQKLAIYKSLSKKN